MATPRTHIEEIRRNIYWIGREEKNPVVFKMLYKTVKLLSAELYAKDVHFLMELIQNAEDNEYPEGVDPSLEFVLTSRDITGSGAPATLLVFNNEKGFSAKNIESICSAGLSTKEGNRKRGQIGEKGIGFKSVFLITARPYIFSNGYQIRFSEDPCPHCNLAYMVPEWVEKKPSLSDINQIYGSDSPLPTTIIILPLKPDKVKPVKQQLSSVHPELLLFLSKIKKLSVRELNENSEQNTVSSIAINSETNFMTRKTIDAESYTLYLSANGNQFERECSYYMWKQKFPVKEENRVERRMDVEEWVINLAFPHGERLQKGATSPGVYAFLPTEMVTNFPFIIQADFVLASSRETILFDNKWNEGILNCVPSAFVHALVSLVKMTEKAPVSSLPPMFNFLPLNSSSYQVINGVRESIKAKLAEESIIPSESFLEQKFFHKPREVGRLMPPFWNLLKKAKSQGVSLSNISSHGIYVLNSAFDKEEYNQILDFLSVKPVNNEWYAKCIQSTNLVLRVSDDVYSEILLFLADNWSSKFNSSNIGNVPIIKYVDFDGSMSLCSINDLAHSNRSFYNQKELCVSDHQSWLIDWNREFRCVANRLFMPASTYDAIRSCHKAVLLGWLNNLLKVVSLTVNDYAGLLISHLSNDRKLAVAYAHFLYHSLSRNYISSNDVYYLCRNQMLLVDNYGNVSRRRSGVLVPANGSKWVQLIVSNPWREQGYIELGEDYSRPANFAGQITPGEEFFEFLKSYVGAADIPHISPPDAGFPGVSAPLTSENAFLLLDWIKNMKGKGIAIPNKFLTCIKEGSWLKVSINGYSGTKPPSESFFLTSSLGNILKNGSVLVDIPLVDQSFYGARIHDYKEELKAIGVMFEYAEACEFIGKRLMTMAASSNVTRSNALSILNFIKFLVESYLQPDSFIRNIREGRWLKTCHGYRSPVGSVLFDLDWKVAAQISDIPFIDQPFYGEEILCFKKELKLLGVLVRFDQNYQLVVNHLKSPTYLSYLTAEAVLLVLECLRYSSHSYNLVKVLGDVECLKTNAGYKSPRDCFLFDPEWGCLLQVINDFPIIDQNFYGNTTLLNWKNELKQLGVVVDLEKAAEAFAPLFRQKARSCSISKDNVLLLLSCYRQLKVVAHKFPTVFFNCIREEKWLRTRLCGYRSPRNCILFGPDWKSISPITVLPFIDDSDSFYGEAIHIYSKELESMGVVVKLEDGVMFVLDGLITFLNPNMITSANVLALLKCIRISRENNDSLPESFLRKVSQKWLKTQASADYFSPEQCCLFDAKWESCLKRTDGPFIDEMFYGSEMKFYKEELKQIGVAVDVGNVCQLLACHLDFHSDFDSIVRIFNFLSKSNWKPDTEAARRIWIPKGSENGIWVKPRECILHDKDGLFGSQLNALEKHYDRKLLSFFSSAFGVKSEPSVDDYCKLWKVWENSGLPLPYAECCAFWRCVNQWSLKTQKHLADNLLQLPVNAGPDRILLLNNRDVFIADDLQLKEIFEQSSTHSLFVWHPQHSVPDLPRTELLEIYRNIGVRTISESVKREELTVEDGVEQKHVKPGEISVARGLLKLILGFLADLKLEAKERHEAVKCLLNLTALQTSEPITVRYSLSLSSGESVVVSASQMIRWDKESSKFFTQKIDRSSGYKNLIEYATHFSEAISKGVLWNREEYISALSELIKCGFLLEFDEAAVGFLMMSKNLQIFREDEEFLSAAFPSE